MAFLNILIVLFLGSEAPTLFAQVVGDEAEMQRLQNRAEEAIANGDADGAALHSGKAALMAGQLAKRNQADSAFGRFYRGAEALFRSQEHGYRALALYQRAGGQPPASSGVCSTMQLAGQSINQAMDLLELERSGSSALDQRHAAESKNLLSQAQGWVKTIEEMEDDFQCP
nr:hypothetical protein [Nitrospirota bacterium]